MEVDRFGTKLLRIDVPLGGDFVAGFVSHFYGGAAIFSITPTDGETVRRLNRSYEAARTYSLPAPDEGEDDEQPF